WQPSLSSSCFFCLQLLWQGSSLFPTGNTTSWLSPSTHFAFGFYKEGNGFEVGIWLESDPNKTVVWTANRDDPPVSDNATLLLTRDGWLLLKNPGGPDKNITGADQSASSASLLDSGNFVLYNSSSTVIWESFSSPTDTILGGQRLLTEYRFLSSFSNTDHKTGRFLLRMQSDGNLVLYPTYSNAIDGDDYWASNTAPTRPNVTLILDNLGQLYLANSSNLNMKSLGNGIMSSSNGTDVVYRATLDTDGNFRLYSHIFSGDGSSSKSISWSALSDQCSAKGYCGFNSYCTNTQPDCICLPGFNFSDPINKFQGCERSFRIEDCNSKKDDVANFIQTLYSSISWRENPYYVVPSNSEEDCRNECLRDCECEVAWFRRNRCQKFSLPLTYGKTDESTSLITFVKVGNESSTIPSPINPFSNANNTGTYHTKKELRMEILIIGIVLATFSIAVFIISAFLIYRHRVYRYKKLEEARNFSLTEEIALRFFSYEDLLKATDGFKEELGKGAFGTVYKGSLSIGGRAIAVKRLEKVIEEGEREFRAETRAIGRTHHRNLVRLLGFCDEGSHRLLVYEYMCNGSLANLIFKAQIRPDWNERVRIAIDVARGILYLHEDCEPHIIHCDIKPQNILMDDSWTAKISDFGLAKLLMPNQTRTFTQIRGTRGYVAPEWHRNKPISVKADVYSFGIVLLEIVFCRRNVELDFADDEIVLSEWVDRCFLDGELDKLLGDEVVEKASLERMVKVGLWCIQDEPHLRPSMKTVILMLEGIKDVPILPSPTMATHTFGLVSNVPMGLRNQPIKLCGTQGQTLLQTPSHAALQGEGKFQPA
ncbi:G-type lectin S-receptor-like serine/threonine-protein kinase LECRK4, partial [Tasmannia lanceolata]|uniref:G-type lectin S-receptor-like serine/threonine-protein kinase LECRK4 n=1 Tax=Tasmannia lanceolata TaxID=3420 RepID=UPI004062E337